MAWLLRAPARLLVFLSLFLCLLLLRHASAESDPCLEQEASPFPKSDKCWVFMHLQKCGGSTVKRILSDTWGPRYFIYDSMRWKMGGDFLDGFARRFIEERKWSVMTGGYPEALRRSSALDNKCRWFTVFRHPISRLVSAYFYCRALPGDQACASEVLNARDADLLEFAKHWGSFGMRQFALSLVDNDEVMAYARSPAGREKLPQQVSDVGQVSGWYLLKMYLDEKGAAAGVDIPDAALYEMLEPVQVMLLESYAAVGILEEFNTTLSLFDAALDMPGVNWERQFREGGKENVDRVNKIEEEEALERAWTDPEIRKYVWLDLLLYGHAVAVFHQQAQLYGLE